MSRLPSPPANVIDFADPAILQIRMIEQAKHTGANVTFSDLGTIDPNNVFPAEVHMYPNDWLTITGDRSWDGNGLHVRNYGDPNTVPPGSQFRGFVEYNYENTYHDAKHTLIWYPPPGLVGGEKFNIYGNQFGVESGTIADIIIDKPKAIDHSFDSVWFNGRMMWPVPPPSVAQAGTRHWMATENKWYGTNTQRIHIDVWMPPEFSMPSLPVSGKYEWSNANRAQQMMVVRFVAQTRNQFFTTTDASLDSAVVSGNTAVFHFRPAPNGFESSQALTLTLTNLDPTRFSPLPGSGVQISTQYINTNSSWNRISTTFNFRRMV